MNIVGVDLAAKQKNPTGICILNQKIRLLTVYSDKDIINSIQENHPGLIALDAPLIKERIRVRTADRLLRRYGALPPTLPSMQPLVKRGVRIADIFVSQGFNVIEVLPTATAKIIGVYSQDYKMMAQKLGIQPRNEHEVDAYLAALTGLLKISNRVTEIGDDTGRIIIPKELEKYDF
jgi:predicted nuclease with RNAse H fold